MKILVIGSNGQLGSDMAYSCQTAGFRVTALDFPAVDITNVESLRDIFAKDTFDVCINCAAFTAVDACETEREKAFTVNAAGVENIARQAERSGATVVHFSTDYVFDGTKKSPYVETDPPNPLSVYGKSKHAGETALIEHASRYFIYRIAWLFGLKGNNFIKTIRSLGRKNAGTRTPLKIVNDQFGSPTCTTDVCRQVTSMLPTRLFGLYHCTSAGYCSRFDFARFILDESGIPCPIEPISTAEFPRPAPVPAFGVLENKRLKDLGFNTMPNWKDSVKRFIQELDASKQ